MEGLESAELNPNTRLVHEAIMDAANRGGESLMNAVAGMAWVAGDSRMGNLAYSDRSQPAVLETAGEVARWSHEDLIAGVASGLQQVDPADPIGKLLETLYPLRADNSSQGFQYHQWMIEECLKWFAANGSHESVDRSHNDLVEMQFVKEFDRELWELLAIAYAKAGNEERSRFLLQGAVIGLDEPGELETKINQLLSKA